MVKKKSEVILPVKSSKKEKKPEQKTKKTAKKKVGLYTNLSYKRKAKKEAEARRKAEDLATLPKSQSKDSLRAFIQSVSSNGGFLGVVKKQF